MILDAVLIRLALPTVEGSPVIRNGQLQTFEGRHGGGWTNFRDSSRKEQAIFAVENDSRTRPQFRSQFERSEVNRGKSNAY
jgi:hypothetical protein